MYFHLPDEQFLPFSSHLDVVSPMFWIQVIGVVHLFRGILVCQLVLACQLVLVCQLVLFC